jgi:hypothetical protein
VCVGQTAQWTWSNPLTERRAVGCLWVIAGPELQWVSHNAVATTVPLLLATFIHTRNPEVGQKDTAYNNIQYLDNEVSHSSSDNGDYGESLSSPPYRCVIWLKPHVSEEHIAITGSKN